MEVFRKENLGNGSPYEGCVSYWEAVVETVTMLLLVSPCRILFIVLGYPNKLWHGHGIDLSKSL